MGPIISPKELEDLMERGDDTLVILDASFQLSGDLSCHEKYRTAHIPGAQFFDITEIRDHVSSVPNMLPTAEDFETYAAARGVRNESQIVIYSQGSMAMGAPRAWWMFRVFGHDNVRVLDGGLKAWGGGLTDEIIAPKSAQFKATFHPERVVNKAQVEQAVEGGIMKILDARASDRFLGKKPEPRPGLSAGHIPGSTNLPTSLFINDESGQIKPAEEIKTILKDKNIQPNAEIITTCGSGVTACFLALILQYSGYPKTSVYDGSWAEWGMCVS